MALVFWRFLLPMAAAGTAATLLALCLERLPLPAVCRACFWRLSALLFLLPLPIAPLHRVSPLPTAVAAIPAAAPAPLAAAALAPAGSGVMGPDFWSLVPFLVLGGALALFCLRLVAWGRLAFGLSRRCLPESSPQILAEWERCRTHCQIHRRIRLLRCPGVDMPMAWGLLRPAVLLPEQELPPQQLRLALLHELTHLRGGDLFWKRLAWLAGILHWWNPLAHLLASRMDKAVEQRCDETLAGDMTALERRQYAGLLLSMAGKQGLPGAAALGASGRQLKARLEHILEAKKPTSAQRLLGVGAAVLLLATGMVSAGGARLPMMGQKGPSPAGLTGGMALALEKGGPIRLDYPLEDGAGYVSMPFWGYRSHTGTDFAASYDTDVLAAAPGTVVKSVYMGAYGNHVMIDHGYGYATLYGHLSRRDVEAGAVVKAGDIIGGVGMTGSVYGNLLHLELRHNGVYLDPMQFIKEP